MSAVFASSYGFTHKRLINHDIMNCTAEGVAGNHLYSGRALGISEPTDIIQLHPDLEPIWPSIHTHYQNIGLTHASEILWDVSRKSLGEHLGYTPSVFYFGPEECIHWGDTEWLEAVEYINSKNNFVALAEKLGVGIPETLCFDSVDDIQPEYLPDSIFPCYLKAAISVSGVGIYRCENRQEFAEARAKFDKDVPVQIQDEVISETFLNLQYRIEDGVMTRLAASEQVLDGFVHQGNKVPACCEPWEVVEPMAIWLQQRGMKGIFAFDVAVVMGNQGLSFKAIECNPRFNGASYPTLIAEKLDIIQWRSITISTTHTDLSNIYLSDIEYSEEKGSGIIIFNWGTLLVGKLAILLAGTPEQQAILEKELQQRL